jgi:hypothetical protein
MGCHTEKSLAVRIYQMFIAAVPLGLGKACYLLLMRQHWIFPGSSAVEQSTVNRSVASSNLARGAIHFISAILV